MVLHDARSAYLIGIKGVGMTALAQVLRGRGVRVSGSDTAQRFFTDEVLRHAGISVTEGFAAMSVPPAVDLVVRSTAYGEDHVEVAEAHRRGIPVRTFPEVVAAILHGGRGMAVCGTHGKTTTTAMLGWILAEAGRDPTIIVGGEVPQLGGCGRNGDGDLIVLEADEYQDKLQHYAPHGVVLTAIEYDHPDSFPTFDAYVGAFRRFIHRIPTDGFLIACADDPTVREVAREARCAVIPYGCIADHRDDVQLQLPGRHNLQNALGALAAAERLGVPRGVALRALASFQGTRRRFDIVGVVQSSTLDNRGIVVIDDYGHHPTEIRVTLTAARERYPERRILCAFHPHTFSRTIALKDQFATAFIGADRTYVMDIYGSAREQRGGITPTILAAAIAVHSPASASGNVEQTVAVLARDVRSADVVLCIGAGENDRVARGVIAELERAQAMT